MKLGIIIVYNHEITKIRFCNCILINFLITKNVYETYNNLCIPLN